MAIGLLPTADFALHGTSEEIRQFVPKLMLTFFFYGLGTAAASLRYCLRPTDWRNGSASDSSPEGYAFESRIGH